ncbi:MAG TPA: formate dehydrogenase accessory sulfurtransferase FdhD [Longimicrobiales bacterium]|nr:formate dehydrogenase accessory sulfurtransferase FdhD [Longimicrobiales bacterium]
MEEAPVWISVNGQRSILLTCTPSETDALATGHLLASGWIRSPAELHAVRTVTGPGGSCGVEVEMPAQAAEAGFALRAHMTAHGCGPRHYTDCAAGTRLLRQREAAVETPAPAVLAAGFRSLFAATDEASPEGGVHAAALFDGAGLHHAAVDVARHCAVDRVIGIAAMAGDDLGRYGLVLTSRVSGVIALKAVLSGVSWVASRSMATSLAHDLAAAVRMPLLERAARVHRGPR